MTAFTTSQMPTGARAIETVEELAIWSGLILARYNSQATYNRETGKAQEPLARVFSNFQDADGNYFTSINLVIPIDPDKIPLSIPDWKCANQMASTPIGSMFGG